MRKLGLRVFIVLSVLVVGLSFLTANVYGEENFSDLNNDMFYYDSVMELVNDGVVSGYSDGTFKPDKNILVCEAISIIEKVFGNSENLPEWYKWYELTETGYIYETDWEIVNVPEEFEEWYKKEVKSSENAWYAPMNRTYAIKYAKEHGYKYLIQLDDNILQIGIKTDIGNRK